MRQRAVLTTTALLVVVAATLAAEQSKIPADWKWRIDGGTGSVTEAAEPKAGEMTFVTMAPGWHVTTGPAALLYQPDYQTKNTENFAVEAEVFLFPGTSQEEYGIFIGGKNLTPQERPSYLAFVARRDGMGMIRRGSGEPIVNWKVNDAILPHPGKDTVKNILRVEAGPADIVFSANGKEVARIARMGTNVNLEGYFGFRLGKDINMHASRLDVTHKLAPVPVKK
jgi:hypothetical protein